MSNTIIIFTQYMITGVSVNLCCSSITHVGFFKCYVLKFTFGSYIDIIMFDVAGMYLVS